MNAAEVADSNMRADSNAEFRRLPVAHIVPNPHNTERAKRYDQGALQELADSIKANGLAQPILVTPYKERSAVLNRAAAEVSAEYVIVAGERRWHAHKIAGLESIDCLVRDLSDKQIIELQLVENLQREGLHPLQEADGYDELLHRHGLTIDGLANRIGKSRAYIFARLKLRDLVADVRTEFYAGKFGSETALLIARIPVKDLQKRACKEIISGRYGSSDVMTFREAQDHLQRNYMLRLAEAPFDPKDAKLAPSAGACTDCTKRTGNQPELFPDIKGADICTDPTCFASKKKEATEQRLANARVSGQKIITGAEAKKAKPTQYTSVQGGYVEADRVSHDFGSKTPKQLLGKDLPPPALLKDPHSGEVIEVVEEKALKAALKAKGLLQRERPTSTMPSHERARVQKAKNQSAIRRAIFMRVREKMRAKPTAADLQMVAEAFFADIWHEGRKEVLKLWEMTGLAGHFVKDTGAAIAKLSSEDLVQFTCDCALVTQLHVGPYDGGTAPRLMAAAKRHGVDVDAVRKEIEASARETAKTKARKKGAKK